MFVETDDAIVVVGASRSRSWGPTVGRQHCSSAIACYLAALYMSHNLIFSLPRESSFGRADATVFAVGHDYIRVLKLRIPKESAMYLQSIICSAECP